MSLTIYHNGRSYNNAFNKDKELLQRALMNSNKQYIWKKQKYNASTKFNDIDTHDEFVREVTTRVNVFPLIFENLSNKKEDEIFSCEVFDGNEAWIGVDNVEYRYFTRKSPKHVAVGYTIIDFMRALQTNCDVNSGHCFLKTRRELVDLLNVSYEESDWEKAEEQKIANNLKLLKELYGIKAQRQYSNIQKHLKRYLPILEKMLKSGMRFINSKRKDKFGNATFFFYSSYSGLSKNEFDRMIKKFKELDIIIVECKEDTYFDKTNYDYVTKKLQFFSFPSYSKEFFLEIEEKLSLKK